MNLHLCICTNLCKVFTASICAYAYSPFACCVCLNVVARGQGLEAGLHLSFYFDYLHLMVIIIRATQLTVTNFRIGNETHLSFDHKKRHDSGSLH